MTIPLPAHKQCGNKVRYTSRAAANRERRRLMAATGDTLNCYKCPWCGGIHLGHSSWRVKQAHRERTQ